MILFCMISMILTLLAKFCILTRGFSDEVDFIFYRFMLFENAHFNVNVQYQQIGFDILVPSVSKFYFNFLELLNEDQHYIIFELELGGTSLEDYRALVAAEAKSILHQVCQLKSSLTKNVYRLN